MERGRRLVVMFMVGVVGGVEGSGMMLLCLCLCLCVGKAGFGRGEGVYVVDEMMIVRTQGVHAHRLVFGGLVHCGGERASS